MPDIDFNLYEEKDGLNDWDYSYMTITNQIAGHSKCAAKKVGCIIVKNDSIISSGVNGTPKGYINCNQLFKKNEEGEWTDVNTRNILEDDSHHNWSNTYEIHAEVNALSKLSMNGINGKDATLYCNFSPCLNCCKTIIASGIKKVVYMNEYDNSQISKDFLKDNGIEVYQIKERMDGQNARFINS